MNLDLNGGGTAKRKTFMCDFVEKVRSKLPVSQFATTATNNIQRTSTEQESNGFTTTDPTPSHKYFIESTKQHEFTTTHINRIFTSFRTIRFRC